MSSASLFPPDLEELLRHKALLLSQALAGSLLSGSHRAGRSGIGIDFREHRSYLPGDDPRQIDWRAAARRDRLILRQSETEDRLRVMLLLDRSGAMADAGKLVAANALAGGFAWLALQQGDEVGLMLGQDGKVDESLALPRGGRARFDTLAARLAHARCLGSCPWPELVAKVAPRLVRKSLLVLVSDFLDPTGSKPAGGAGDQAFFSELEQLAGRGHIILLLQVLQPSELGFPADRGELLHLEDPRGIHSALEAPDWLLRESYETNLRAWLAWLDARCERSGLHLQRVQSNRPLSEPMLQCLGRLSGRAALAVNP